MQLLSAARYCGDIYLHYAPKIVLHFEDYKYGFLACIIAFAETHRDCFLGANS